jgi:hypothetical protein
MKLLHSLAWQKIETETPTIPASHAILTHLSFIDIAVEELRPRYMRGSRPIEDGVASELNGVVHKLSEIFIDRVGGGAGVNGAIPGRIPQ